MTFRSWIDQQIAEAEERGAFDNLPGTGKPLPNRGDSENAWLIEWMRREGISTEELLPTPLKLRKQSSRLASSVHELGSEREVRDAVDELNYQIKEWRKIPIGPPVFVPLVDAEAMVGKWREAQQPPASVSHKPEPASHKPEAVSLTPEAMLPGPSAVPPDAAKAAAPPRRRWWRRRRSLLLPARGDYMLALTTCSRRLRRSRQ
jgi:hypothetical protein